MYDLVVTKWGARYLGRRLPVSIGRSGITTHKREGDGATPAGVWRMIHGGFRADRIARPDGLPMRAVGARDVWSDDPKDPAYNHWARGRDYPFSHEALRRPDPLYDLFYVTDWNWPDATPGGGSAIFVHCWRGPRKPTAGCIAFRPDHLRWIAAHWTPRSRLLIKA